MIVKHFAAFLCALLLSFGVAAAGTGADEVVRNTSDQVIARLKAEKATLESNPDQLYELVNEVVVPHFDFERMSQWVLGKSWKDASPEEQAEFVRQFQRLLVRTYASALQKYTDQTIKITSAASGGDSSTTVVKTEVVQDSAPSIPIDYRLYQKDGTWKVFDVSIDGISMVSTYRSTFAEEIKKGGISGLIQSLTARNAGGSA